MILKIIIKFYRWLWGLGPFVIQTLDEQTGFLIILGAIIDLLIIFWIVEYAASAYKNRKKSEVK